MTWYMNFCAPFIPNDDTINFHRYLQASTLLIYLLFCICVYVYYKFWGPMPLEENSNEKTEKNKQEQEKKQGGKQSQENSSSNSSEKDQEVSIKIDEQANQSCVELKKTNSTWEKTSRTKKDGPSGTFIFQNVTLAEVQNYFPIVFGHFAVTMGLSIMYSPYAEQSLAAIAYLLLTIPLLILNAKRYEKCTNFVWGVMTVLIMFILTCGLLEVGQSNWDIINLTCFSTEYVSLYD